MDPLVTEVLDFARRQLSDTETYGGEIFTNDVLTAPFGIAYRELFTEAQKNGVKRVEQIAYFSLAAYTSVMYPAQAGISNLGVPLRLRERGAVTDTAINGAVILGNGTLQVTTSTPHTRAQNDQVTVWGIGGILNATGTFFVDVVDASTLVLRGSLCSGAYTSGGSIVYGTQDFMEMRRAPQTLPQGTPQSTLDYWLWQGDKFLFTGANQEREVEILYTASGAPPAITATGSVGFDDSLNFLGFATARHAVPGRPMYEPLIPYLEAQAQKHLADLIQIIVRSAPPARPKQYRDRFRRIWF